MNRLIIQKLKREASCDKMEKRWHTKTNTDPQIEEDLAQIQGIGPILARLLAQRGITSFEEARTFFNPSLAHLHDPFIMKDMDKAVSRIEKAIKNEEKILIYGDYDVDGTTSVALVYSFLYTIHKNIDYYIPDRYNEGYGISYLGIDFAAEHGFSLVIALDCGIKAVEKIEYARQKGVEFIICDHHTPGDRLPGAIACLDPKRSDCSYPEPNLSGCGVGFKLMQALSIKRRMDTAHLYSFLDLVAVSIASDIVPITGENRILASLGLEKLNREPGIGLRNIIKVANMEGRHLSISDIVFKIGPRINAAGRIESGKDAVALLISRNDTQASHMSLNINVCNETRKDLDRTITREALELIDSDEAMKARKTTVLYDPNWHKGVIGIVASRLTESYYRPTVILTLSKEMATGSARSVEGYDLYAAIDSCSDLLENFGGHRYAAGLTLKPDNIAAFTERFEKVVSETILPHQLIPQIEVDEEIHLGDITPKFYKKLKRFSPFGPENLKPVFVTRSVMDYGTSKAVGKDKEHLKLELIDNQSGTIMQGIAFSMGPLLEKIKEGNPFDICYTIEENVFNGHSTLQLMVRDIKFPS